MASTLHMRSASPAAIAGVQPMPSASRFDIVSETEDANGAETSVDLLFKNPWTISRTVEFMAGVGPELIHATGGTPGTFWGPSAVADIMFWPRKNIGWYVEPGYEVAFRRGTTEHGLALAGGLIIGR